MLIVEWAPITETDWIPPFGDELKGHIEKYENPTVRHASCSTWGLLYKVLVENGLEYGTVVFEENGKPSFSDHSLFFSLSHSRGVCAVAVSDHPVGVDVELCRDKYSQHLIERSLSENEKRIFDDDFTRLWCRKESIAKMSGKGITGYPNEVDTSDPAYCFKDEKIEYKQQKYWLVAVIV